MDLEDSHPAQHSQQDCLDTASCDLPQDTEDVPPTPKQHEDGPDDATSKSRKSNRRGLDPDRIVDKRKKKSVEKVSEWLMKISPSSETRTEGSIGDAPGSTDSETEESKGSSVSAELRKNDDNVVIGPLKEVQDRPLEEQVFGAVYKRDRKAGTSNRRTVSSEVEIAALSKKEKTTKRRLSKRNSGCKVAPEDSARKADEETNVQDEPEESTHVEEASKSTESPSNKNKSNCHPGTVDESPSFDVPLKRPGRRPKMKIPDTWTDMDQDLTTKETSRKRHLTRSSSEGAKDQSKYTKSLTLVSAGTKTFSENPKLLETQVTIESYPSIPDPKSSGGRTTRRSLRLQEFTEEVQGPLKRKRAKCVLPKHADRSGNDPASATTQHPNLENIDHGEPSQQRSFRTNGCIFTEEMENIETAPVTEDAPDGTHDNMSVIPDTGDQDRPRTSQPYVDENLPRSPENISLENVLPGASSPEKTRDSPSLATVALEPLAVSFALVAACEDEVDTNESELDTEQLMKTFKGTTRKSFCLGSPKNVSPQKSKDQTEPEEKNLSGSSKPNEQSSELFSLNSNRPPLEKFSSKPSGSCKPKTNVSSVVQDQSESSPSNKSQQDHFVPSGTSESLMLSPNKVVKSTQGSQLPANLDPEHSCQLFSTGLTQEDPQRIRGKSPGSLKDLFRTPGVSKEDQRNESFAKMQLPDTPAVNFESSATPDGLVPTNLYNMVEPEAGRTSDPVEDAAGSEILSQPCVPRTRRTRRLESSDSESSPENERLPSLAQIFKSESNRSSSPPGQVPHTQSPEPQIPVLFSHLGQCVEPENQASHEHVRKDSQTERGEELSNPGCRDEWINASQGSVDLFGTQDECE